MHTNSHPTADFLECILTHQYPTPKYINVQLMEILGLSHVLGTAQTASIFWRAGVPPKVIVTQTSLPMHSDGFGNLATHDMEYEVVAICNAKATTKIIDWATTRVMDFIEETADIEIAVMAYAHAERDRKFFEEMDAAHAAIRRQFALQGWQQEAV